jgi:hypothetical protein
MKRPSRSNEMKKGFFAIAIIEPDHPFATLMIFSSLILTLTLYPFPIPLFPYSPVTLPLD